MAVLAPITLLGLVALVFRAGVVLGAVDPTRPLRSREGFGVIGIGTVIGLPFLGSSGLVDPWETHYAEVAREMLERHDLVSPWWGHEGWFTSKPVLTFWLEALAMKVLGVQTGPDQVLAGAAHGMAHPEWAVRFPHFAFALVGTYVLYSGVAHVTSRRVALLGAFVLWTMPGFALLSHQAMTDMPLVASVAGSLGFLLRALATTDAVKVGTFELRLCGRVLHFHAGHAVAVGIAILTFSQVIVPVAQHLSIDAGGLHVRPDRLLAGSPHACMLPGQIPCSASAPAHRRLTPILQASLWIAPMTWLVLRAATELRVARLLALLAWACAALAVMAKGPAGLVVPAAAVLVHLLAARSLRPLLRLEIPAGLLLSVTMIGPWYLAVYARNGRGFLDELVMRHMLGRTLGHLHDTNEGEDVGLGYFVRQLGYATFPWSGIALLSAIVAPRPTHGRRAIARSVLFGAVLVSFVLVSSMQTKFHHYILVALPPIAMLAGIQLAELASMAQAGGRRQRWAAVVALGAAGIALLVARDLAEPRGAARIILILTYRYSRVWPSTRSFAVAFGVLGTAAAATLVAFAVPRLRRRALVGLGAIAFVVTILVEDVYLPRCASDGGQRPVIAAFYAARAPGEEQPLVAYQMNWKGENFYTGNHLAIFVSSGGPMKAYLDRRRSTGARTVYFVSERARTRALQAELGAVTSFRELTPPSVSAEFTLLRVEL